MDNEKTDNKKYIPYRCSECGKKIDFPSTNYGGFCHECENYMLNQLIKCNYKIQ